MWRHLKKSTLKNGLTKSSSNLPMTSRGVSEPTHSATSATVNSFEGMRIPRPSGLSMMMGSLRASGSFSNHSDVMSEPCMRLKLSFFISLVPMTCSHLLPSWVEESTPACKLA